VFTGIVEEVAVLERVEDMSGGKRLHLGAPGISSALRDGDSVAVDGVCQTVTGHSGRGFTVECLEVSLQKTTLGGLRPGSRVNLERAVLAGLVGSAVGGRLDGHIVQGHVNGRGNIISIEQKGDNRFLTVALPPQLMRFCIPEGAIAINGVSLTIAEKTPPPCAALCINIIPHTWEHTAFPFLHSGDEVNIETDIFARYIEHFFGLREEAKNQKEEKGEEA